MQKKFLHPNWFWSLIKTEENQETWSRGKAPGRPGWLSGTFGGFSGPSPIPNLEVLNTNCDFCHLSFARSQGESWWPLCKGVARACCAQSIKGLTRIQSCLLKRSESWRLWGTAGGQGLTKGSFTDDSDGDFNHTYYYWIFLWKLLLRDVLLWCWYG